MESSLDLPPDPVNLPLRPLVAIAGGGGSVSLNSGQSIHIQFELIRVSTDRAVDLSVGSLPQGVTAAFTPPSLLSSSSGQQFSLTLTAAADAPPTKAAVHVIAAGPGVPAACASVTVLVQIAGQVRPRYQLPAVAYAPSATSAAAGESQVVCGSGSTGTTSRLVPC